MDYSGKVVVITAAASGIGREAALAFGRRGGRLVISDIDEAGIMRAAEEVRATGAEVVGIRCDVSSDDDVAALAARTFERFGQIDILMNHAGASASGPAGRIPLDDWRFVYEVNVLGIVRALNAFFPHMVERRSGLIINTSSGLGLFPEVPFALPYITTKAGVIGLSEALALYCRPLGIRVMALLPDITKTQFHYSGRKTGLDPSKAKSLLPLSQEQLPVDVVNALMESIEKNQFIACNIPNFDQFLIQKSKERNEPDYRVYAQVRNAVSDVVLSTVEQK